VTAPRRTGWTTIGLASVVLAGCGGPDPEGAIPDAALFSAIAGLDGVASSDVGYSNDFGYGAMYSGDVRVATDADAACILFQSIGILQQGRQDADPSEVTVVQADVRLSRLDLPSAAEHALEDLVPSRSDLPAVPDCSTVDLEPPHARPTAKPTSAPLLRAAPGVDQEKP
jgi:hypothetical protein